MFVKFLYKSYDSCLCFKRGLNFFNLLKRKKNSALNNFNKSYRSFQFYRELIQLTLLSIFFFYRATPGRVVRTNTRHRCQEWKKKKKKCSRQVETPPPSKWLFLFSGVLCQQPVLKAGSEKVNALYIAAVVFIVIVFTGNQFGLKKLLITEKRWRKNLMRRREQNFFPKILEVKKETKQTGRQGNIYTYENVCV